MTRGKLVKIFLPVIVGWVALCGSGFSAPTRAQDSTHVKTREERNWGITIPLWIPGYRGQFAIGDISIEGEGSGGSDGAFLGRFFDNKLKLNFFFMGTANYERDRWRFYGDLFGGKFTDDVIFKLTDGTIATATVQPFIANLHADYRVYEHRWGDSAYERVRVSGYGGFRIYDVRLTADVASKHQDIENTWADPIIGVWIPVDLSRKWSVQASGDIGGFDIGSKFSWHLLFEGSYWINELFAISLGYNILDVDYRDNVAAVDFVYKVRVGGPLLGLRFNF